MEETGKEKLAGIIDNFQQLLKEEDISDEEIEKKIKDHMKPFSENLKAIIRDIEQRKKDEYKEIGRIKTFVKNLESIQHPEVKKLMQKENDFIIILEDEKLLSEKFYAFFKSCLDLFSFMQSKDLTSTSKKKSELQLEIYLITEDLKKKGII